MLFEHNECLTCKTMQNSFVFYLTFLHPRLHSFSGVFYSKLHKTDKPTSNQLPSQKPFLEEDNRMGILAGLSISLFFLLVFIVICVVKEPCKKINTGNDRTSEVSENLRVGVYSIKYCIFEDVLINRFHQIRLITLSWRSTLRVDIIE